ncbi:TIGR02301 family protein [Mesorhizobium sp. ASY16-5R]|uniref:TIGR02301 family protein n=1 Tax=Mesorhizobium sp. ASY16-5R TaxID=3445772 RepID=UPI003FA104B2
MGRISAAVLGLAAALTVAAPGMGRASESPYENGLLRLSEVLGSLHFLRSLCGETGDRWRGEMEKLLAAENPDPARRERFVARFNRGYRSFADNYTSCTASATEAISRYMKEGEELSREIAARQGN